MTHYHKGQRCLQLMCADPKDPCPYADTTNGPCTLFEGHAAGTQYGAKATDGHLFAPYVPTDPAPDGWMSGVRNEPGWTAAEPATAPVAALGDWTPDLDDVLRGEIVLDGQDPGSEPGGYPDLPGKHVWPSVATWEGFPGLSPEQVKRASERLAESMREVQRIARESFVLTASSAALVAALIERARTEQPSEPPAALASTVDAVCETLRGTGMFTDTDLAVVRRLVTHLARRQS